MSGLGPPILTGTTINPRGSALLDDSRPTGRFGVIVVGAAFLLALATFLVFARFTPILPTPTVVWILLVGDGLVVIILIVLIGIELFGLRAARRAARAGARLHSRFVGLFALVAAIPAIVTAVVAGVSVEWAINPKFMSDVASFINEANQATQLYGDAQCRALLRDADLTAGDLARSAGAVPVGSRAIQGLFQLAGENARVQRRRADEERRIDHSSCGRVGPQADRQA